MEIIFNSYAENNFEIMEKSFEFIISNVCDWMKYYVAEQYK